MVAFPQINIHDPNFIGYTANNINCVIVRINREGKWFRDAVEFPVGYAYDPNKIFNVINMLLMWLI